MTGVGLLAQTLQAELVNAGSPLAGKTQVLVVGGSNGGGALASADLVDVDSGTVATVFLNAARTGARVES